MNKSVHHFPVTITVSVHATDETGKLNASTGGAQFIGEVPTHQQILEVIASAMNKLADKGMDTFRPQTPREFWQHMLSAFYGIEADQHAVSDLPEQWEGYTHADLVFAQTADRLKTEEEEANRLREERGY